MTTTPQIHGHYAAWHTTDPADMPPLLKGDACPTQQMWESITVSAPGLSGSPYASQLAVAAKKAALPLMPSRPVFKAFTPIQLLAKVHEYTKAAWRRGDLGAWQSAKGAICFMGGVYRFLVFEASTGHHEPRSRPFEEAAITSKPLTDALRSFALVLEEQRPEVPHLLPVKQMTISELSNYIIGYNDRWASGSEEICGLLEKAMVRELERV